MADLPTVTLDLADEEATMTLGRSLADALRQLVRDGGATAGALVIELSGDLGAGKTTLARALLRGLGVTGRVRSPTYTLMEPYLLELAQNISLYCYHFDFYRFTDPREWLEAGFREYFDAQALCLVEWPEKLHGLVGLSLPQADVKIALTQLEPGPGAQPAGRRITLQAFSPRGAQCLIVANFSKAA